MLDFPTFFIYLRLALVFNLPSFSRNLITFVDNVA